MLFIEGVGYVDNTNYSTKRTEASSQTDDTFDHTLQTETDKLNQAAKDMRLEDIFHEASEKYGVSERLLKAVAYAESGFQADATSSAGAMGIMQLMPSTARAYGVSDPYDAYQSIMGGAAVLKNLLQMFDGNQSLAIAAYNAGCGNVKKYGGIPPFSETQNYVAKVTLLVQNGVSVPNTTYTTTPVNNKNSSEASGNLITDYTTSNETDNSEGRSIDYEKILDEIKEIISALSTLNSNSSSYTNRISQSGINSLSDISQSINYSSLLSSNSNPISDILSSMENTDLSDTDNLQNILSYAEYRLLTSHYANMLDIISVLGSTGITEEQDTNDTLSDLFQLATRQKAMQVVNIDFASTTL